MEYAFAERRGAERAWRPALFFRNTHPMFAAYQHRVREKQGGTSEASG